MPTEKPKTKGKNGGARPGSGRKPFSPTPTQRALVKELYSLGFNEDSICQYVGEGIHKDTLRKYFNKEKCDAKLELAKNIMPVFFSKCMEGDVQALKFFIQSKMKWTAEEKIDLTSSDGSMSPVVLTENDKSALDRYINKVIKERK